MKKIDKATLIKMAKIEKARREFWYYCKLMASDFYKDNRTYLKEICDTLQEFYEGDKQVLCINLPP